MSLRKTVHIFLALLFMAGLSGGLTACNTVEGVGEDISSSARAVKRGVFK